jgi:outer membrane protein assembly factor BamE (lipoprotein component of BamABCDE complex)
MNIQAGLVLVVSMSIASGCASVANSFVRHEGIEVSQAQLDNFIPGQTTEMEVASVLGKPTKQKATNGRIIWQYAYHQFNANPLSEAQPQAQLAIIEFDENGYFLSSKLKRTGRHGRD